ncbi:hypothetical protein FA13DRAFT_713513 [Coprinellus micaceus]|uniref:Uncharacterized protein n=1 Tax=Coprinellus micaceus TaxID=71717 RepID=A0A4Y7TUV0_COPMI|nr:hypothetical protein FA13DRAFT_713513 [Coprinellus micaceus]
MDCLLLHVLTHVPRMTRVRTSQEFRCSFSRQAVERRSLNCLRVAILAYSGSQKSPVWIDSDPLNYPTACTVEVNTTSLPVQMTTSATGARYFEIGFEIILLFGLTELQAQIAYRQNGQEKRGRAQVIYEGN